MLKLHCNSGKAIVIKKEDLKGYGTLWYDADRIAYILSLSNVQKNTS